MIYSKYIFLFQSEEKLSRWKVDIVYVYKGYSNRTLKMVYIYSCANEYFNLIHNSFKKYIYSWSIKGCHKGKATYAHRIN